MTKELSETTTLGSFFSHDSCVRWWTNEQTNQRASREEKDMTHVTLIEQHGINRECARQAANPTMLSSKLATEILAICEQKLLSTRPECEGDHYSSIGQAILLKKIQTTIDNNRPIEFLLPGFPCKSPNLNKVSGRLPDAGEIDALEYLNGICGEISQLYAPGCQVMVWSDGRCLLYTSPSPRD